ncbi:MAG: hypothetical protein ACREA9_25350, partial [Pyrinomonadaceae bacterium]
MKDNRSSTSWNTVVLAGTGFVCMVVLILIWYLNFGVSKTAAQSQDKTLEKLESYANEPLRIVEVKAANKSIRLGEGFSAGEDWLKNASFTVKNLTDKDIIYIEIDINFPETKSSGNEMSYRLKFGHRPAAHDSNPLLNFKPNDDLILSLEGDKYDRLIRFVGERQP